MSISLLCTNFFYDFIALEQNDTWPFVTLSSFQRRAAVTRSLSGAVYLSINHYVTDEDLAGWEKYTAEDPGHYIAESIAYMNDIGIEMYEMPESLNSSAATDVLMPNRTTFQIFMSNGSGSPIPDPGPGPYLVRFENFLLFGMTRRICNLPWTFFFYKFTIGFHLNISINSAVIVVAVVVVVAF